MKKKVFSIFVLSLLATPVVIAQQKVDMYVAGDLMAHQSQLISAQKDSTTYDFLPVWQYVKDDISSADISIANMETTLFDKGTYSGYPRFKTPVSFAQAAVDAGFDIFLLANNHIYDQYRTGVRSTIKMLDSLGVKHVGAYRDTVSHEKDRVLIYEKKGIKFAILNYTYATNIASSAPIYVNYIDTIQIEKDILLAKEKKADIIVATFHWGREYQMLPQPIQQRRINFLLKNGVSVIIGGHPHVVQPMECIKDKNGNIRAVVYNSLGNYISGQRTVNTQGGAAAHLSFQKDADGKVKITDASYSLVWVWKPKDTAGREQFYILPVRAAEKGKYPLTSAEKELFGAFTFNARELFSQNNKDINERKE
ncbi:MAG: CapA family protein [Flavobacteriales bacterium]|nr:CapA family protein [Flavobacteriales bacterium]